MIIATILFPSYSSKLINEKVKLRVRQVTYEPFPIALESFPIKLLNGDLSGLVTGPHTIIYDTFIHNSKATFSQNQVRAKVLGGEPQLLVRENINIAVSSTLAQIFDIHGT